MFPFRLGVLLRSVLSDSTVIVTVSVVVAVERLEVELRMCFAGETRESG